jgi:hypothetical protein
MKPYPNDDPDIAAKKSAEDFRNREKKNEKDDKPFSLYLECGPK